MSHPFEGRLYRGVRRTKEERAARKELKKKVKLAAFLCGLIKPFRTEERNFGIDIISDWLNACQGWTRY